MLRLCYVVKGHAPTVSEVKGVGLAEAEISHCSARVHATFFLRIHNNKRISVNFKVLGQEQKHGKSIFDFSFKPFSVTNANKRYIPYIPSLSFCFFLIILHF